MEALGVLDERLERLRGVANPQPGETCSLFSFLLKKGFQEAQPHLRDSFLVQVPWEPPVKPLRPPVNLPEKASNIEPVAVSVKEPPPGPEMPQLIQTLKEKTSDLLEWSPLSLENELLTDYMTVSPHYLILSTGQESNRGSCLVTLPLRHSPPLRKKGSFAKHVHISGHELGGCRLLVSLPTARTQL